MRWRTAIGSANRIVQLVIGGETDPTNLVLVVNSDTISVTPTNGFTETGATNLTIVGNAVCTDAVVEVQVRGLDAPLARLHVMVLPWVTNSIGIYRVVDTNSPATSPVGGPDAAQIINTLNSVYAQACVRFVLDVEYQLLQQYDWMPRNGRFDWAEERWLRPTLADDTLPGNGRIWLFKENSNPKELGFTYQGNRWSVVFTHGLDGEFDHEDVCQTVAHEMGHQLNLSTRNSDGEYHDEDPPPEGTVRLMHPSQKGYWMRHQDWGEANYWAKERAKPR